MLFRYYNSSVIEPFSALTARDLFLKDIAGSKILTCCLMVNYKILNKKLEDRKIKILGTCETSWKGAGITTSNNYNIILSGGERGVASV